MRRHTGIAAFSDLRTPSADGVRDAFTTRPSASANFFVDSTDADYNVPASNFTISKNQSLFNGFFNRIAVNEIVLDWGIPNVAAYWGNNTFSVTNDTTSVTISITLDDGFYSVMSLLNRLVFLVNSEAVTLGDPLRLSVGTNPAVPGSVFLNSTGAGFDPYIIEPGKLARQLFKNPQIAKAGGATTYVVQSPLILGTNYIDIVCQQLTYNQDLKDNTTSNVNRDVLYRWYFADDNNSTLLDSIVDQVNPAAPPDQYLLMPVLIPIVQGYTPFIARRTPPVVKQIRWSPEQPIGQVSFQVYDDTGKLLDLSTTAFPGGVNFQFQLSMLLSED